MSNEPEFLPEGSVTTPPGFTAAAAHAGLKAGGALDVALLVSSSFCATAGVFTTNAVRAAPVLYDEAMACDFSWQASAIEYEKMYLDVRRRG